MRNPADILLAAQGLHSENDSIKYDDGAGSLRNPDVNPDIEGRKSGDWNMYSPPETEGGYRDIIPRSKAPREIPKTQLYSDTPELGGVHEWIGHLPYSPEKQKESPMKEHLRGLLESIDKYLMNKGIYNLRKEQPKGLVPGEYDTEYTRKRM